MIRTLYNTDNGHEIPAPERKFIQTEPLYYGHSNDDSSYSTRFPVCRYISESLHKWKKDAIDKIVEKEGLKTEKKVDKKFCIFLD